LPDLLLYTVMMTVCMHLILFFVCHLWKGSQAWNFADAANLHYIGKCIAWRYDSMRAILCTCFVLVGLTHFVEWWVKILLVGATWDDSDTLQRANGIFGLLLGGYALVPAIESILSGGNNPHKVVYIFAAFIVVVAFELFSQAVGVFVCPSHDLTIRFVCAPN